MNDNENVTRSVAPSPETNGACRVILIWKMSAAPGADLRIGLLSVGESRHRELTLLLRLFISLDDDGHHAMRKILRQPPGTRNVCHSM